MSANLDFDRYVDARWADLVGGLEDEGVPAPDARLAVAETLLASRRAWARRVRDEQIDVSVWAELRERCGLPARPGEAAPHGVRATDPHDGPEEWLDEAGLRRAARRRVGARRGVGGLAVAAALVAGWMWWAAHPAPPDVREETNALPVVWYAEGELHLTDVVVDLPGIDEFVSVGPDVVARMRTGDIVRVDGGGAVTALDDEPAALDQPVPGPSYMPPGRYDVGIQSVPVPGGGWAYLIDSSRRAGQQDAVRQSETGRRALVVCPTVSTCGEPVTFAASGTIRLR